MSVTAPERLLDFADAAGDLAAGRWIAIPYETYGRLDRDEWNTQAVQYFAERSVPVEVIDVPRKSVTILVNADAPPTFEQVVDSIAAIRGS